MTLSKSSFKIACILAFVGLLGLVSFVAKPQTVDAAQKTGTGFILARIEGKAGILPGSSTRAKFKDWIEISGYDYQVLSPRDPASGLAVGKRQHKPINLTKNIDKASPFLFQALVTSENLKSVQLDFYNTSPSGGEVKYYGIILTNASLSDFHQTSGVKINDNNFPNPREELSFTYQKIQLSSTEGGVTVSDDWSSPVS